MKNIIVEMVNDNNAKTVIYTALVAGKKIMYTTNLRATPYDIAYISDNLKIAIEPDKKTIEYFDKTINRLEDIIDDNDISRFKKALEKMNNEKRRQAVASLTKQYEPEDIIQYIMGI